MPTKGIIALLLSLLLAGCVSFQEPEFVCVNSVEVKELTLSHVSAVMNIRLHNPNRHSITINDVDIDVICKNSTIGKLSVADRVHISSLADADCNFSVRMSTAEAVRAGILSASDFFNKNDVSVRLSGTIKGKYGIFKRKLKVNTTIKQKGGK
ncbi:MAG: LEA type 2 family protein [Salinivirgaceae bacterium]|nr:LEA type 2 family protein [Salinivirgaceae bacterium]